MTTTSDTARRYIQLGWGVIPLRPGEKVPTLTAWQKNFFTTTEETDAHWSTHPHDGIGLVTGEKTGILVLDVDRDHDGFTSLASLVAEHEALPETAEAATGGGGKHYLFRYPVGHHIGSRVKIRPGIDIRAGFTDVNGVDHGLGQIVAYPSTHPDTGKLYTWVRAPWDVRPAEAPTWLVNILERATTPAPSPAAGLVPAGARHGFLLREAGRLHNLSYGTDVIAKLLRTLYEERCELQPPMPDAEIDEMATWFADKPTAGDDAVTPRFPIEVMPRMTGSILTKLADAQDVSIDYVATQALVVAAAAIGTTRVIKCHTSKDLAQRPQPALLYLAVIGDPGTAKTESRYFLEQAVKQKEQDYLAAFERAAASRLVETAKADQHRSDLKKRHTAAVAEWAKNGGSDPAPEPPDDLYRRPDDDDDPVQEHAWTDSATVEGIAEVLTTSPRGLLVCPDELSKLWLGLNRYSGGAGNEKQHFLEAWNAGAWNIIRADRKKNKYIPRAHISVVGGLQPDLLPMLRGEHDDGTIDRWLFAWPEVTWLAKAKAVNLSFIGAWEIIVDKLYSLTWETEAEPGLVLLDGEALAVRDADYAVIQGLWAHGDRRLRGFYGKWGQLWARLALILHLLKWAEGEHVDPDRVDGESARAATALMQYFMGMTRKALDAIGAADDPDGADGVRACWRCEKPLTDKQRSAKYCSDNCRKRANEERRA